MLLAAVVLLVSVAVEGVQGDKAIKSDVFRNAKLSVNGSSAFASSRAAASVRHCSALCLAAGDCVAANFDDGVCHMSPDGHVTLEESSTATAILMEFKTETFPGKQASVNGSSSFPVSRSGMSLSRCAMLCQDDADCAVANYDQDAGVCHMSRDGQIRLEDNAHVTAIFGPLKDMPHVVGWWPLQEAYGGRDVSGHGNHIELYDVTFPADSISPWASPAALFANSRYSYGHITNGHHLDVLSFSFVAKVYFAAEFSSNYRYLCAWQVSGSTYVFIEYYIKKPKIRISIPGCSTHSYVFPTVVPMDQWHTLAVTFDFPTNTVTIWVDATKMTSTHEPCGTAIITSSEVVIGKPYSSHSYYFAGRISCMILYNAVEDYDVMTTAILRHCAE